MEKLNSKLFGKFKDEEITLNTSLIIGGAPVAESSRTTGDTSCTGGGTDCTDPETTFVYDVQNTATDSDHCE